MEIGQLKEQMQKGLSHLEQEFAQLQIGRASTGLVENIDVYVPEWDMKQKLNQMGNVTLMDAQTIKIECWDKNNLTHIEKAIYDSGSGLTPQNMGEYMIINIPPLTKERRQELTKVVSHLGEDIKVRIRNVRQDGMKALKRKLEEKEISEDEKKGNENKIDELTKEFTVKIDALVKAKSEEVMKV